MDQGYTAKAAAYVISLARRGLLNDNEDVLLWSTKSKALPLGKPAVFAENLEHVRFLRPAVVGF